MRVSVIIAVILMMASVSWAGNIPSSDHQQLGVVEGRAIPHLNVRALTPYEEAAINRYMAEYGRRLSAENASALRQALETLVGIDQSHVPLTRKPADYLSDWQTATQLLNRTEWKVKMPASPPAPVAPAPRKRRPRSQPAPAPAPQAMYLPQQAPPPMSAPLPVITGGQTVVQNAVMTASWCGNRGGNITVTATGGVGAAAAAAAAAASTSSTSATPTSAAGANNGATSGTSGAAP